MPLEEAKKVRKRRATTPTLILKKGETKVPGIIYSGAFHFGDDGHHKEKKQQPVKRKPNRGPANSWRR